MADRDLIPIPDLRGMIPRKHVGGTPWHLKRWIAGRGHNPVKIAGKWNIDRAVALKLFPKQSQYIEAWPEKPAL